MPVDAGAEEPVMAERVSRARATVATAKAPNHSQAARSSAENRSRWSSDATSTPTANTSMPASPTRTSGHVRCRDRSRLPTP